MRSIRPGAVGLAADRHRVQDRRTRNFHQRGFIDVTHLVFICGHAGAGKTTLAKRLVGPLMKATGEACCLLDKDTLYGVYSAAAIGALTGDPNDRDSPLFLQHFRDPEYRGLFDTAAENLRLGIGVIAVGPLSREVRGRNLFDHAWLGVPKDVQISVVWVSTSEETARERIAARGNPNDAYKLAHWDDYRQRRFVPAGDERDGLLMFDNTSPASADYDALLAQIVRTPQSSGPILPPMPV
jgi:predicted kinase